MRAVPLRGVEYGLLRYLCDNVEVVRELERPAQPEILFNYMGHWGRTLSSGSRFRFVRPIQAYYGSRGSRSHLLDINALIFNEQLRVDWRFNKNLHSSELIATLAEKFRQMLCELIAYCVSTRDCSLTPSDFLNFRDMAGTIPWKTWI